MNVSVRIAVADDEPRMRQFYQEALPILGHDPAKLGNLILGHGTCTPSHPRPACLWARTNSRLPSKIWPAWQSS